MMPQYLKQENKTTHIEVVQHSAVLILQILKLFELHFHIPSAVLFR
jgi:hypothetical protein